MGWRARFKDSTRVWAAASSLARCPLAHVDLGPAHEQRRVACEACHVLGVFGRRAEVLQPIQMVNPVRELVRPLTMLAANVRISELLRSRAGGAHTSAGAIPRPSHAARGGA